MKIEENKLIFYGDEATCTYENDWSFNWLIMFVGNNYWGEVVNIISIYIFITNKIEILDPNSGG